MALTVLLLPARCLGLIPSTLQSPSVRTRVVQTGQPAARKAPTPDRDPFDPTEAVAPAPCTAAWPWCCLAALALLSALHWCTATASLGLVVSGTLDVKRLVAFINYACLWSAAAVGSQVTPPSPLEDSPR